MSVAVIGLYLGLLDSPDPTTWLPLFGQISPWLSESDTPNLCPHFRRRQRNRE